MEANRITCRASISSGRLRSTASSPSRINELAIAFGHAPNQDALELLSSFTLGSTGDGIDPVAEVVTLQVGTFTTTIPPGSFTKSPSGTYTFIGTINGVSLEAVIWPTGSKQFAMEAAALNANLTETVNPVKVTSQDRRRQRYGVGHGRHFLIFVFNRAATGVLLCRLSGGRQPFSSSCLTHRGSAGARAQNSRRA